MIKYFVRTTGERSYDYSPLFTTTLYDFEKDPINSFIEELIIISEYDSVLLEDDLLLCDNFQNEIEQIIAQYPDNIINFFTDPTEYIKTELRETGFRWNQCTYYPKGIAEKIAYKMKQIAPVPKHTTGSYTYIQNNAMTQLQIPHICYRPSLVQHIGVKSILWTRKPPQFSAITPYFLDYLKEANISYDEVAIPENHEKLLTIANQHYIDYIQFYEQ